MTSRCHKCNAGCVSGVQKWGRKIHLPGRGCGSVGECLLHTHDALGSSPRTAPQIRRKRSAEMGDKSKTKLRMEGPESLLETLRKDAGPQGSSVQDLVPHSPTRDITNPHEQLKPDCDPKGLYLFCWEWHVTSYDRVFFPTQFVSITQFSLTNVLF